MAAGRLAFSSCLPVEYSGRGPAFFAVSLRSTPRTLSTIHLGRQAPRARPVLIIAPTEPSVRSAAPIAEEEEYHEWIELGCATWFDAAFTSALALEYLQLRVLPRLVNDRPFQGKGNRKTAPSDYEQLITSMDAVLLK
jgi:hypothetical protein